MSSSSAAGSSESYLVRRAVRKILRPLRRLGAGKVSWGELQELGVAAPFGEWGEQRVLVVFAHPDDEAFCSGLVATLAGLGAEVRFLCMTRGEGGDLGDVSREEIGRVRDGELWAAAEVLGVSSVGYLGYVDPLSSGGKPVAPAHDGDELAVKIRQAVLEWEATVVVTHGSGGEYWHPAHVCLHDSVRRVAGTTPVHLVTMNAWNPDHPLGGILNRDDSPDFRVDGEAVFEKRLKALEAHVTQRGVFERFCGGTLEDFVRATGRESYRRVR